ncbi:hypothetical protein IU487_22265 [Nocardia puris]|uniref:hypothetical protein n=1 Tax=Nocardia puris TaxID=208602 RepID=UPI001895603D|nr:hypothetical protein [Nocardia puris]MBF6213745.1 hypothetical protein [Nocardia puris]
MSSIKWRLRDGTPADPDRLYQSKGGRWEVPAPDRCPNGHSYGDGRCLVGTKACLAVKMHRTYRCRTCDAIVYWPPVTEECAHGY